MSRSALWSQTLRCALGVAGASVLLLVAAPPDVGAQQAVQSPHGTLPEGLQCSACHTAKGWTVLRKPLGFEHGAKTGFALTGAHTSVACTSCHTHLRFDEPVAKQNDCASCHTDVHQGRMLQECAECHTTTSFRQVDGQRIHARTSFPLTGAHSQLTCEACHVTDAGGAFSRVDPECASCHMKDYQAARAVNHVTYGFPTTCTVCHNTVTWNDTRGFDHATVARGYALVGAHAALPCASCHRTGDMAPLFTPANQNDCVACHQADYNREHAGSGFPTTCLSCHNQTSWGNATVDHGALAGGFQLLGAHTALACTSCHAVPGYALLFPKPAGQNDCVTCHQTQFTAAHGGQGFPNTCAACHTVSAWTPSTFDHDSQYFPIYSGTHQGRWSTCADCHTASGDFSSFSCLVCHTQSSTDPHHTGVNGYVYASSACYSCHRNG